MSEATRLLPRPRIVVHSGWIRAIAWMGLIGATGLLVRAEPQRRALSEGVVAHTDIVYRDTGRRRVRLDLYLPTAPAKRGGRPAIVAIHGGGWRGGSKDGYGPTVARLAQHGYVVAAVDYRLSRPGRPSWPENFEDVREAVRWLRRHASEFGIDPHRIAAMGASAGGHLSALLGTYPDGPVAVEGRPARATASPSADVSARVQAVIDFYGPMDLRSLHARRPSPGGPVFLMLGGTPGEIPGRFEAASPLTHVSQDDPPTLLIHGTDDALVPLAHSEALAKALEGAGVPNRLIVVDKARHGFGLEVPGHDLLPEILAFLNDAWTRQDLQFSKRSISQTNGGVRNGRQ